MRLFVPFLIVVLFACGSSNTSPILAYYPPLSRLETGYVSKYYKHYYPKSQSLSGTEIIYRKTTLVNPATLKITSYNAGFSLSGESLYTLNGLEYHVDTTYFVGYRYDTLSDVVVTSLNQVWQDTSYGYYEERLLRGSDTLFFKKEQTAFYDTLVDGVEGKVFASNQVILNINGDTLNQWSNKRVYLQDLGYYSSESDYEKFQIEWELVEQMSVAEFEKRSDHDRKRVAYVDPENTLDDHSGFKLCSREIRIADYYNSDPKGEYLYGKDSLRSFIFANLDDALIEGESGYLTFRFVVNCEGEAGRFTTGQYALDFEIKRFEEAVVNHFYTLLASLKEWRPVVIQEEGRDAYFYITFKLKHGELIEILP